MLVLIAFCYMLICGFSRYKLSYLIIQTPVSVKVGVASIENIIIQSYSYYILCVVKLIIYRDNNFDCVKVLALS